MQLLTARFAEIATAIEATTAQITALQAHLSDLQELEQKLLSVEQACQSALSQAGTALMMLNHVDPSQVAVFKEAMAAKFAADAIAQLPASAEQQPQSEPALAPEPEPSPEAPAVDVELVSELAPTLVPQPETQSEPENEPEPAPSPEQTATLAELKALSIQQIRKLASKKSVKAAGTRADIAARLAGLVTSRDLRAIG